MKSWRRLVSVVTGADPEPGSDLPPVLVALWRGLLPSREAAARQAGFPTILPRRLTVGVATADLVDHLATRQSSVLAELRHRLGPRVTIVMEVDERVPAGAPCLTWSWDPPEPGLIAPAAAFLVSDTSGRGWTRDHATPGSGEPWCELSWRERGGLRSARLRGETCSFGRAGGRPAATVTADGSGADARSADIRIVSGRSLLLSPTLDGRGVRIDNVGQNEVHLVSGGGLVLGRGTHALTEASAVLRWPRAVHGDQGFELHVRPLHVLALRWSLGEREGHAALVPGNAQLLLGGSACLGLALSTLDEGWFGWTARVGDAERTGVHEGPDPWQLAFDGLRLEAAWIVR